MKIRNFGLELLIVLLQATAGPYGNSLLCHAGNSKEGEKKNHPKLLFQFGICCMPMHGLCRLAE